MKRRKFMIMGLLTAVATMVGTAGPVVRNADAAICEPGVCVHLNIDSSTPECKVCYVGEPCEFTIGLSRAVAAPVTVGYATLDGTAVAGVDFAGIRDGRTTIPAGATRGGFTVQVFRSEPNAPSKVFHAVLTGVSTGSIGNGRVEVHISGAS